MNRATKIILAVLVIFIILAALGWLGYDNYQQDQQLNAFENYQSAVENKGQERYNEKLGHLKGQLGKLAEDIETTLAQASAGQFFAKDTEALKERLTKINEEIRSRTAQLDTVNYGSNDITEEDLMAFERRFINHLEAMREIEREDSEIAKQKMKRYQYQLRAYKDSMTSYLRQKQTLLEQLNKVQEELASTKKNNKSLSEERNRLLSILEGKDHIIDSMSSDTTGFARTLRALEDSINSVEGRDLPAEARDLRCYYVPKDKDKRGQVWLNEQPIHTPNKVRDVYIEFDAKVRSNPSEQSKMEIVLLSNRVPIRSVDVVASNGTAATSFDCAKERLQPGNYEIHIKYMGEVIRKHKFMISKPTLF